MANIRKAIADAESGNTLAFATGKVLYCFACKMLGFGNTVNSELKNYGMSFHFSI